MTYLLTLLLLSPVFVYAVEKDDPPIKFPRNADAASRRDERMRQGVCELYLKMQAEGRRGDDLALP